MARLETHPDTRNARTWLFPEEEVIALLLVVAWLNLFLVVS